MTLLMLLLFVFQNAKPEIRIPDLEKLIHQSINLNRRVYDREPLILDDQLGNLARAHSEDMVKRGYFKHVNPEGLTPMKRLEKAGHTMHRRRWPYSASRAGVDANLVQMCGTSMRAIPPTRTAEPPLAW